MSRNEAGHQKMLKTRSEEVIYHKKKFKFAEKK